MSLVYVRPYSTDPDALEATANTLATLHPRGGHTAKRDESGAPVLVDGELVVESVNAGFLIFAVERQGYAISARECAAASQEEAKDGK